MIKKFEYIFTREQKIRIGFLLFLIIIGSFLELMGVAVFMPFISLIMDPEETLNSENYEWLKIIFSFFNVGIKKFLVILAIIISIIYILKNLYLTFMQNEILSFNYKTRMHLAVKLLSTYMHEPYTFHLNHNIAELQRCLMTDAQQFMGLLNNILQLISEGAVIITIVLYLFHTSHAITVMVSGFLVLFVGCFMLISRRVSGRVGRENEYYQVKLNQWINQAFGGIKEVKVLKREEFFVNAYKENYQKLIKGAKLNEMLATVPKYMVETVCMVGLLMAVVLKLVVGQNVAMTTFIPQLTAFAIASFRLLPSVGKINAYISGINYYKPSLDNIYADLKEVEKQKNVNNSRKDINSNAVFNECIEIHHVSFHYPDSEINVINDVELKIPKGKTYALIGASGAGKTTLADIILGLLKSQSGCIKVDDWNIEDNPNVWHGLLGYIPQTIYLTDDTIRRNIAFGVNDKDIDEDAVIRAVNQAQLRDYISSLPAGLDSYVGDRGVRISGGQRQRIGIARALYKNPQILILDEATSALDNDTETAVMESIEHLQGEKTMIIIAHRLTTIRNADKIYEVEDGKLVERSMQELGLA